MNTINKFFGIEKRDGYYWTGLFHKNNTTKQGFTTWGSAVLNILGGRWY